MMVSGFARLSMCGQSVDAQVKHLGRIDPSSAVTESTMESAAVESTTTEAASVEASVSETAVEPATKMTVAAKSAISAIARVAAPSIVVIRVAVIVIGIAAKGSRRHRSQHSSKNGCAWIIAIAITSIVSIMMPVMAVIDPVPVIARAFNRR